MRRLVFGLVGLLCFTGAVIAYAADGTLTGITVNPAAPTPVADDTINFSATASFSGSGSHVVGDGTVDMNTAATGTSTGTGVDVAIGEVTGDSNTDLILVTDGAIEAYPGDGTGGFSTATTTTVSTGTTAVATAYFDAGATLDVALANSDGYVYIRTGDGSGGFSASGSHAVASTSVDDVDSADFNNDTNADLVVLTDDSGTVGVYVRYGTVFTGTTTIASSLANAVGVAAGDADNDGDADIVVLETDGSGNSQVTVHSGDNAGNFSAGSAISVGTNATHVEFADLNGDGHADLAVTRSGTAGNVDVYPSDGAGGFASTAQQFLIKASSTITQVTAGDLTGDSKNDLAAAVAASAEALTRVNTTPADASWSTSDATVISINAGTGAAFVEKRGSATITGSTEGQSDNVPITVPNSAPVAYNGSYSTPHNTGIATPLVAADADEDTLSYSNSSPANGALSGTAPSLTYTPNTGWAGTDSFTFQVYDGFVYATTATVTIDVTNNAPTAVNDTANATQNGSVVISPLTNDSDTDGDAFSLVSVTQPAAGTGSVVDNGNGTVTYTPGDYYGSASFTYTIQDTPGASATGTVNVTVAAQKYNVMWVEQAKVAATGTTLTKSASTTSWDAGAISGQKVPGDGGVEFKFNIGTVFYYDQQAAAGLNAGEQGVSPGTIDYSFFIKIGYGTYAKEIHIRENGVDRGTFGTYTNQLMKIEREGTTVRYYINGLLKHTSTVSSSGPLVFDASIQHQNEGLTNTKIYAIGVTSGAPVNSAATVSSVSDFGASVQWNTGTTWLDGNYALTLVRYGTTSGNLNQSTLLSSVGLLSHDRRIGGLTGGTTYYYAVESTDGWGNTATGSEGSFTTEPALARDVVVWTDKVNVTAGANGNLTKVAGAANAWDAGAASTQRIYGDGGVTWKVGDITRDVSIGLSYNNTGTGFPSYAGTYYQDTLTGGVTITTNSVITMERVGTRVFLYVDGKGVYDYPTPTTTDSMLVDSTFREIGSKVTDVYMFAKNVPPAAGNDSATTDKDTPVTINVLANDSDPEGAAMSVTSAQSPTANGGTTVVNGDDTVTYTPAAGFTGNDSFTYDISDGNGGTATGTVSVYVNAPPSITSVDSPTWNEGGSGVITTTATDVEGPVLSYYADCNNDGNFTDGTPDPNVPVGTAGAPACTFTDNGVFTVGIQVADIRGLTDTTTTTVTINNVPPSVDSVTAWPGGLITATTTTVSATVSDPGADTIDLYVNWGDGNTTYGTSVSGTASVNHTYAVGVYTQSVYAQDDDGGTSATSARDGYSVVYDPALKGLVANTTVTSVAGSLDTDPNNTGQTEETMTGTGTLLLSAMGNTNSSQINSPNGNVRFELEYGTTGTGRMLVFESTTSLGHVVFPASTDSYAQLASSTGTCTDADLFGSPTPVDCEIVVEGVDYPSGTDTVRVEITQLVQGPDVLIYSSNRSESGKPSGTISGGDILVYKP